MKSLKQIYVEYEIGEIYPENLPYELKKILNSENNNQFFVEILNLTRPTRSEIDDNFCKAIGINDEQKISNLEKLDLLINRWKNNLISGENLFYRIRSLSLDMILELNSLDFFLECLVQECVYEKWVPGDEWDYAIEDLKKEIKLKNKYSEFKIKTSC